jgi:hypothetical protein
VIPTGFDNAFICGPSFPDAARRFVAAQLDRWPGLLLDEERFTPEALTSWSLPEPDEDGGKDDDGGDGAAEDDMLTFCRDAGMDAFWEEHGYALDATGQGPFALFYGRYTDEPVFARQLTGVRQRRRPGESPLELEGVGLLLSEYYAVTLVTPEDPAEDAFSAAVLGDLLRSFDLG